MTDTNETARMLAELLSEVRQLRANTGASMGVTQAARCLGVSDKTVSKWIADGRLRVVPNTGRRVLIARAELERFANAPG